MVRNQIDTIEKQRSRPDGSDVMRERLLSSMPVTERRVEAAGISTAVLEGGSGPTVVLLHGPGGYAAAWMRVIPDLVRTHRVVVPDLPGHGVSVVTDGPCDADRVLHWLGELIAQMCDSPPTVVGQIIGGAIAARYAAAKPNGLIRLVLVDALGLAPFHPAPQFGQALTDFIGQPNEETHDRLWEQCTSDLGALQEGMGANWERLKSYNVDRARATELHAAQQSLMNEFGFPAIPPEQLACISVPTTLVWGRHDLATKLQVAEAASDRYGWPLHIIENAAADSPLEQPEAFVKTLREVLKSTGRSEPQAIAR